MIPGAGEPARRAEYHPLPAVPLQPIHQANTVRAMRVALDGDVPAGHAALLVRDDPAPFALVGRWAGGGALVGSAPVRVAGPDEDPFAVLADPGPAPHDAPPGFVGGGWVGLLGFALGREDGGTIPPIASPPTREALPAHVLARYDHLLHLDADGQWWFEALWTGARAAALDDRLTELRARLARGVGAPAAVATAPWRAEPSPAGHARAVEACRERIAAGDLYQANLALRLRSTLDGHPADLFARAADALRPDRAAYLAGAWGAVASLSPELFLTRHGDRVSAAPIKGTRRRPDDDPEQAEAARRELAASVKDHAENVMIVDLMRNDLGRVSVPGSVEVGTLAEVRPHPGVWHLVSEVHGQLLPGTDDAALLRATFPPGSVTGAPKRAALEVVAELESVARQAFTGAIGFASPTAGLELSVVIRTFEVRGDDVWLDVGGGIVADSEPAAEAAEALVKAQPLLDAIGARLAEAGAPVGATVPVPRRLGPRPVPRPDPALGLFESIAVVDGVPAHLGEHLDRLATSVAAVYGGALPADVVPRAMLAAASATGPCRLRIVALPDGGVAVTTGPLPVRGELRLAPVTVPGGLGAHKWLDRRLVDALSAAAAPAIPLLVDLDGQVLEGAWANVLIVGDNGVLVTPPLDGRILPGVTRARVLQRARAQGIAVAERPLGLDELRAAREVLLTSSLARVLPVGPHGPVGAALRGD